MQELSNFGNILRKYVGTGQLHLNGNKSLECEFEVAQFQRGSILLKCSMERDHTIDDGEMILKGKTRDGNDLSIQGSAIMKHHQVRFGYSPTVEESLPQWIFSFYGETTLKVGNYEDEEGVQLCFGIANFEFIGTKVEEISNSLRLSCLPLDVGGVSVTVHQRTDYDEIIKMLKAEGGVYITCEARVEIGKDQTINAAIEKVTDLCLLLSLARGTLVTWLYYDIVHSDGQIIASVHKPPITREYVSGLSVIDTHTPDDIKQFVESAYSRAKELDSVYSFMHIVHAYIEVRGETFLETRLLMLGSLVEYVTTTHAKENGQENIIEPTEFGVKQKELEDQIHQLVRATFPSIEDGKVKSMAAKARGFNFPSLQGKIKRFCREFNVPLLEHEISDFVETRNNLVHSMKFRTENPAAEYFAMVHFLDKMLLSLLGYDGHYIDVTSFERKPLRNNITS